VLAWLDSAIDFEATEAGLDTQLDALANPTVLHGIPYN
jgi:hypothetical protein